MRGTFHPRDACFLTCINESGRARRLVTLPVTRWQGSPAPGPPPRPGGPARIIDGERRMCLDYGESAAFERAGGPITTNLRRSS